MSELAVIDEHGHPIRAAVPGIAFNDLDRMARAIAASGLFGMKTPEQAIALCLLAQAEGLHPATAARDYHIINGRPAMTADAILARFQAAGGVVQWEEFTEQRVAGYFSHPKACPKPVLIDWTIQKATELGLTSKQTWKQFPRAMLRARCASEGVKATYPGVISGVYTPDEAEEMEPVVYTPAPAPSAAPRANMEVTRQPAPAQPRPAPAAPVAGPLAPPDGAGCNLPWGEFHVFEVQGGEVKAGQRGEFYKLKLALPGSDKYENITVWSQTAFETIRRVIGCTDGYQPWDYDRPQITLRLTRKPDREYQGKLYCNLEVAGEQDVLSDGGYSYEGVDPSELGPPLDMDELPMPEMSPGN